jgi:hypothetical protein
VDLFDSIQAEVDPSKGFSTKCREEDEIPSNKASQ